MRRAVFTFYLGLGLTALSFLGLLFTEGAFFSGRMTRTGMMVHPMECGPARQPDPNLPVNIAMNARDVGLFSTTAPLHLRVDFQPFVDADCGWVKVFFSRPFELKLTGTGHYDLGEKPGYGPDQKDWTVFVRNDQPKAFSGGREEAVFELPGLFNRVEMDTIGTRLSVAGAARFETAKAYGKTATVLVNDDGADVLFSYARFDRLGRIMAIVFSALLGIGISAVFEAMLVRATLRRIEELDRSAAAAASAASNRAGR